MSEQHDGHDQLSASKRKENTAQILQISSTALTHTRKQNSASTRKPLAIKATLEWVSLTTITEWFRHRVVSVQHDESAHASGARGVCRWRGLSRHQSTEHERA